MRTTPAHIALTAVLAVAAGLLASWYLPGSVPALAGGAVAYIAILLAAAKVLHVGVPQLAAATTLLTIRVTAAAITTLASLALNVLHVWDAAIRRAATQPTPDYIRAA